MKNIFLIPISNCAPKKIGMTLCITLCIVLPMTIGSAFSQNPLVKVWDYRFGGIDYDWITTLQQTSDGGYILGGWTPSNISGDKTQNSWGDNDFWIVKLDSLGVKLWDKDFGGTGDDRLNTLQQTSDGGYILGGYSDSNISGDKTENSWGSSDYWIIKIDSLGVKQWDKDFGGSSLEDLTSLQQTSDGGYILGGYSGSNISGNKTQNSWGSYDYWVVKLDSLGVIQWDKDFGGSNFDYFTSLQQTSDGGYILGGWSMSDSSGDKTQNSWGLADFWIVKIDSLGVKQWDKDFGGTDNDQFVSLQQTYDRGYILGGWSTSDVSGDKTQNTWGIMDYWVVKIDSLGVKQWDKDFGGIDKDEFFSLHQISNGGYLLSGDSYSPVSGNKSENNLGSEQTWVIKTDSLGNKLWEKTIFTPGHDETGLSIQLRDGCYVFANTTDIGIGGYKSQTGQGAKDYWLIKFCEELQAGFTSPSYLCPGTCIDFTNLSFEATSYQWSFFGGAPDTSTALNPTAICYPNPGSYDVQLIATNANGSDTLLLTDYIHVYPFPPPQSIQQNGDTLFAIPGAGTYQWFYNGNIIQGATEYFYVATQSGNYNVVATDNHGCEAEAVINNVVAGQQSTVDGQQVAIFPNPVNDELRVMSSGFGVTAEISIYNVMGERVLIQESRRKIQEEIIDVSKLGSGLYYIEVKSGEKIYRSKFVKK